MADADPGALLAKLKQRERELKSACQRLAVQPASISTLQRLEAEAQQARSRWDQALDERHKQASQLDKLVAQFAELQAAPSVNKQQHGQVQLMQSSLESTKQQLAQAMAVQQTYQHMLQQLKQGHAEFDRQMDQLQANVQAQQQHIQEVCQSRTIILQCCCGVDGCLPGDTGNSVLLLSLLPGQQA
jgi:chromosome segregation ATPase